jgi:hypothetical protein
MLKAFCSTPLAADGVPMPRRPNMKRLKILVAETKDPETAPTTLEFIIRQLSVLMKPTQGSKRL